MQGKGRKEQGFFAAAREFAIFSASMLLCFSMNAVKLFGEAGIIARAMNGSFESRPQQAAMAAAVEKALESGTHLIVEAGTGVGKSLAYLVPLVLRTREENSRVVVSTYTKALQQQLVQKDLPFLQQVLGDFRFALCVGGENYLCLRRFDQLRTHDLFEQSEIEPLNGIFTWSTSTRNGLRNDLPSEPPPALWAKICRHADLCYGRECSSFKECFYQKARACWQESQILVANHHLYFANLATGGNVLPSFRAVVFDEAHMVEDVATDYLGSEISNFTVRWLLDSLLSQRTRKGLLTRLSIHGPESEVLRDLVDDLRIRAENFFLDLHAVLKQETVLRVRSRHVVRDTLSGQLGALRDMLLQLRCETFEEEHELRAYAGRADTLAAAVRHNLEQDLDGHVYWAERENKRYRLVASPIDIADTLRTHLFGAKDSVVLTSATLSAAGVFTYIRGRLGADTAEEMLLDSPFDFENQVVLYVPPGLEDQQSRGYQERFEEELGAVLTITRGRTLVLFTSYSQLRRTAERLRDSLPGLGFLCQGEMPAYRLLERFRERGDAVLFGTASFWQGIDIPGEALECVVIAKLPFAVPDDPLVEARMERLENPFWEYQVPQATLLFRQGFGRLIRTRTDRGAVVVLDSRIRTKSYGAWFMRSIPRCPVTDKRQRLQSFFDHLRGSAG